MKQEIRIIGGSFRGKKLHFPDVEGLRPTPDRVRETLFNWLMHKIRGATCLDAFAGSGALGFEAFSRGAAKVLLLEKSHDAFSNLNKIVSGFNSSVLKTLKVDTLKYLEQSSEAFDIIFLDPPFDNDFFAGCLTTIVRNQLLKSGGLLYLESPTLFDLDETQWTLLKCKRAGQVYYRLFEKIT